MHECQKKEREIEEGELRRKEGVGGKLERWTGGETSRGESE